MKHHELKTRTIHDGYVWIELTAEAAKTLFDLGQQVCCLYDDGSESVVNSHEDINSHDGAFGLGIGFAQKMLPTCPRCGTVVSPSLVGDYIWNCPRCEEDFYGIEMEPYYSYKIGD